MDQNNITQTIIDTINYIFETLLSSIDNSLYSLLDSLTFINSDILSDKNFEAILGTSASNGIILIANSFLLGIILYFAIKYLLAHFTFSNIEKPHSFIIKLIICGLFMNFSYFILEQFINLIYFTSSSICELGENLFNKSISFSELINVLNQTVAIEDNSLNIFSLDGLIKGTLSISLLSLVFSYSLRYILVKIFILITPFAILSASLNSTSWFFKSWFKNLFSLMFIQILVALVLVVLFSMDYSSTDLFVKFVYIGGIYALIRANSIVKDFIGGLSTTVTQNVNKFSILNTK